MKMVVLKPNLRHDEIYKFVLAIADHKLLKFGLGNQKYKSYLRRLNLHKKTELTSDEEVEFIAYWIDHNSVSKRSTTPSSISVSNLRKLLEKKGISIETSGAKITVTSFKPKNILGYSYSIKDKIKNYSLGNTLTQVNRDILSRIRQDFDLTEAHGIDDVVFADEKSSIDEELRQYKTLIYKLSKV